jgi:hypothetical protein
VLDVNTERRFLEALRALKSAASEVDDAAFLTAGPPPFTKKSRERAQSGALDPPEVEKEIPPDLDLFVS